MIRVELNKSELDMCKRVGIERNKYGEQSRMTTTSPKREEYHIIGALGEYAVSKLFKWNWDYSIGSIDKNDFKGHKYPIDVKTASNKNHRFCVLPTSTSREYFESNNFVFIFCCYYDSGVDVWGLIQASRYFEKAKQPEKISKTRKYEAWKIHRSELKNWNLDEVIQALQ